MTNQQKLIHLVRVKFALPIGWLFSQENCIFVDKINDIIMKKKYTLKQYINPDFHLHLHDDEIQMISKFNYRSKMYTNELLKSTNCKSTTAAFSKVRKSPPVSSIAPSPYLTGKSVIPNFPYWHKCNCEIKINNK